MQEKDALSSFDMGQFTEKSVFLKFEPGKSVVVRVLTTDPIIFNTSFEDKKTGETVVTTKFAWVVFNFTANAAQVMQTTPNLTKKLQDLHNDPDFGSNIKSIDIKITPPEPGVIAAYDVQVLPKSQQLTDEQIKECMKINLEELFKEKGGHRMSFYNNKKRKNNILDNELEPESEPETSEKIEEEPINLDDIPF
jgi:hypothetical protein